MALRLPKDYRDPVKAAIRQGFTLTQTRHGHPKLTGQDGRACAVPSSSRAPKTYREWLATMRKLGLRYPEEGS